MEYTVAMQRAIALAEKGLGKTAPNPIVGAVIIDAAGNIVGEGFHDRVNSPDHAEVVAIKAALHVQAIWIRRSSLSWRDFSKLHRSPPPLVHGFCNFDCVVFRSTWCSRLATGN